MWVFEVFCLCLYFRDFSGIYGGTQAYVQVFNCSTTSQSSVVTHKPPNLHVLYLFFSFNFFNISANQSRHLSKDLLWSLIFLYTHTLTHQDFRFSEFKINMMKEMIASKERVQFETRLIFVFRSLNGTLKMQFIQSSDLFYYNICHFRHEDASLCWPSWWTW